MLDRMLGGDEGLTVEIRGYDLATLDALAQRAADLIGCAGHHGPGDQPRGRHPQQEIRVNRDKVADLGLSVRDVTQLLQTAVAGSKAGEYRTGGNSYRIWCSSRMPKSAPGRNSRLTLTTDSGEKVALRNVVDRPSQPGPGPDRPQGPAAAGDGTPPMSPDAIWVRWPPTCRP
jgi:HAE1 family hydrophobic/amphiphilic exporter-1